jgi:hypothetical protein
MIKNADINQKKKYDAFLNVASAQHSIYPDINNLLAPTLEMMSNFIQKESQATNDHQAALRSTLQLFNNYSLIYEEEAVLDQIKFEIWKRVINHDKPNILEVYKMMEQGKGEVSVYVTDQIQKRIRSSLLFVLSDDFRETPAGIDPNLEESLI